MACANATVLFSLFALRLLATSADDNGGGCGGGEAGTSGANDVVVVRQEDGSLQSTNFDVQAESRSM